MNPSTAHRSSSSISPGIAIVVWCGRGLALALVIAAPWPHAMVTWTSQVWLLPAIGCLLALSSGIAFIKGWRVTSPVVGALTLVVLVGLLQTLPLAPTLWNQLASGVGFSQQIESLAQSWGAFETNPIPFPQTISIYPHATRATAAVIALGVGMLISCSVLFRDSISLTLLLGSLSLNSFAIALLGIYQAVEASDWTLIELASSNSFATFNNRNAAPQFLSCGIASALGLLTILRSGRNAEDADRRYQTVYPATNILTRLRRQFDDLVKDMEPYAVCCLVVIVTLLISVFVANSRGGILACGSTIFLTLLIYGLGKQVSTNALIGVAVLLVLSGVFLSSFGLDELVGQRMETISEEAYRWDNARIMLWSMVISQPACWLFGHGLGTFHFSILPTYETPHALWYYHAENIYLELLSNEGVFVLGVVLAAIGWLFWHLLLPRGRSTAARAARLACLYATLAVLLHNLVDFSLILPGVFLPLAAIVGAYCGLQTDSQLRDSSSAKKERGGKRRRRSRRVASGLRPSGVAPSTAAPESNSIRSQRETAEADAGDIEPIDSEDEHRPRKTQSSRISRRVNERGVGKSQRRAFGKATINRCLLAVCVSILIGAIALGAFSLQGFAMGEQLHELLDDEALAEVEKSPYMHSPDALQFELSDWNDFPEVRLQIGALRQEHAQILVRTAQDWPNEMTDAMRSAISKPEFFSAVLQSSGEEELGALKEIVEKQAGVSTELRKSIEDMRAAITACPLDWRANWGLLRANDGSLQANERLYNYARIYLSCRNHPSVLQAAANHALMTGDDQFGLHIWRELLRTNSYARVRIANLLGNLLDVGQLIEILPPSPLSRLEIAARLNVLQKSSEALDVVQTIDFEQAFTEAKSAVDWRQLAWAAGLLGDVDYRIESLEKAALASPMDAETRYNLALELLQVEKFAEAKEEIDRAMKLSANNTKYKQLSEQIQQAQKH